MYKLNEEKMFFDIADGQAIVIAFTTGMYYGTNSLGSVVLERLVGGRAPDAIARAVKALPGCPDGFDGVLAEFIDKLKENGILVEGDPVPGGDEPIDGMAAADGFELPLDEFSEVQDLILADPVHDVSVDIGWPVLKDLP